MKLNARDLRGIALLSVALVLLGTVVYRWVAGAAPVIGAAETPDLLELRLANLRRVAAQVPGKSAALAALRTQVEARDKHVLAFATAPQAQAHLLELIHRVAGANKIEPRGGDFAPPIPLGDDYGQVAVSVLFECRIEDFVNFMADLSREPELVAPSEIRITAANPKIKTINVRLTLAGVTQRKLVPERRTIGVL